MKYYIGVDGGGTKTAFALFDENKKMLECVTGAGSNHENLESSFDGASDIIMSGLNSLCEKAGIPHQTYVNNSDMRTGSTVGPIVASKYSIMTIDIGLPQLAMHAQREMCGTDDIYYTAKLFKYHFGE